MSSITIDREEFQDLTEDDIIDYYKMNAFPLYDEFHKNIFIFARSVRKEDNESLSGNFPFKLTFKKFKKFINAIYDGENDSFKHTLALQHISNLAKAELILFTYIEGSLPTDIEETFEIILQTEVSEV